METRQQRLNRKGTMFLLSTIICVFNKQLSRNWLIGRVALLPSLLMLQLNNSPFENHKNDC